uniref:Nuclear RNA export factor 1 n=1 Tax=Cacopsylla melanoneura TaxID=428564 RepID=A0A8D8Q7F2_9HEMI
MVLFLHACTESPVFSFSFFIVSPHLGGNRGGGGNHYHGGPIMPFKISPTGWYKCTVAKASKYEKNYIINLIKDYVKPYEFEFYNFVKIDGETYSFFVSNFDLAEKMYLSRGRIKTVTNHSLALFVGSGTPYVELNNDTKEKIKLVMAKRYNGENKALDLSKFYADPDFLEANIFAPLDRSNVMTCVCNIIDENLPDLYALNLSENKLYYRESFVSLAKVIPRLKILYLSQNSIKDMHTIRTLESLSHLQEIRLEKNPLSEKFEDKDQYTSELRKLFPKIMRVDDIQLPPPIVFDLEDDIVLPKPQGSFLCNPEARDILRAFLEQYFALFDTDTRSGLIDAYHDNAQYSLVVLQGTGNNALLINLNAHSRNLLRVEEPSRQKSLLSVGKAEIMRALRLLPPTKHDLMSFTCDCPLFTPGLIQFSVCGVYEEITQSKNKPKLIRAFNRAFLLVPRQGGGFAITNDQLFITSATYEQVQKAFSDVTPGVSTAEQSSSLPTPVAQPVSNEILIKQNMVKALSQATGMNLNFSEKCLTEVQWDYDQAVNIFNALKAKNALPPDAFA